MNKGDCLKSVSLPQRRKENAKDAKSKHLIINPLRTLRKIFAPLRLIFLAYETSPLPAKRKVIPNAVRNLVPHNTSVAKLWNLSPSFMMQKAILFLLICYCQFNLTAQSPQRPAAPPSEPPRVNSVYLGVAGGTSIPFSNIAASQTIGGFGQAEIFVFVTEYISVGTDFAYHYFPKKNADTDITGKKKFHDVAMMEVLINGTFHLNSPWNPHLSVGLGYYGEAGASHFGMVPGIGIMPRIAKNIYIKANASTAFFDMDGHFFKIGAGVVFMVYRHKPIKR